MMALVLVLIFSYIGGQLESSTSLSSLFSWSSSEGSLGSSCTPPSSSDQLVGIYTSIDSLPDEVKSVPVTTTSTQSRKLFWQGMLQLWNFNTDEALRNFQASVAEDSEGCAMCYWGLAIAHSTNINRFVAASDVDAAIQALASANKIRRGSELEKLLIEIQTSRWPNDVAEWEEKGQDFYDQRYANTMAHVLDGPLSDHTLVLLMYVESIMNVHRWDYYESEGNNDGTMSSLDADYKAPVKRVRGEMRRAYDVLERVVTTTSPSHPLALHLWIHITEQSSSPQAGLQAADSLAALSVEWGMGHLSHMPAHTYLRAGLYDKVESSSTRAIDDDVKYTNQCLVPYCPQHNIAVMMHAAMLSGLQEQAIKWAPAHPATASDALLAQYISGLFLTPLEFVLVKFGAWSQLKTMPGSESIDEAYKAASLERELVRGASDSARLRARRTRRVTEAEKAPAFLRTINAYSQALLAINGHEPDKQKESQLLIAHLEAAAGDIVHDEEAFQVPQNHVFFPNHQEMGKIMVLMTKAARAVQLDGQPKAAVSLLDEAVLLQDRFRYMEPEHYYTPVRHCLGAALLAHQKQLSLAGDLSLSRAVLQQAERVYRRDLEDHPNNVWAYTGLHETLTRLQDSDSDTDADLRTRLNEVKQEMGYVLERATFVPRGSCCELGLC